MTGFRVQAPIRSDPSGRCAPRHCTGAGRQIERRTPWSYLGRGQTEPVQRRVQVFTDLAVGLGPVGPSSLVSNLQLSAGIAPRVGLVAGAVVGQDAFDGDPAHREPTHCAAQDPDGGRGGFVVVDLGVGNPGVVIDDGVDKRVAQHIAVRAAAATGRAARFFLPWERPTKRHPPPVGMLPSFLTSTCMSEPGWSCS